MSPAPSAEERRVSPATVLLSSLAVAVFLAGLLFLATAPALSQQEDMNPRVETPESFTNRKTSTYEAGLEALKEKYLERCRLPGGQARGPFDPPQPGVVVIGGPPGDLIPGGPPGGDVPERYILEGSGVVTKVEIEQVITRFRDDSTSGNPWDPQGVQSLSWQDTVPIASAAPASNMICSPGGTSADIFIHIDPIRKTCTVTTNSAGSAAYIWTMDGNPNGRVGYGPIPPDWTGPSGNYEYYAPPGVQTRSFTHGPSGTTVNVSYRVFLGNPSKGCTGSVTIISCN